MAAYGLDAWRRGYASGPSGGPAPDAPDLARSGGLNERLRLRASPAGGWPGLADGPQAYATSPQWSRGGRRVRHAGQAQGIQCLTHLGRATPGRARPPITMQARNQGEAAEAAEAVTAVAVCPAPPRDLSRPGLSSPLEPHRPARPAASALPVKNADFWGKYYFLIALHYANKK